MEAYILLVRQALFNISPLPISLTGGLALSVTLSCHSMEYCLKLVEIEHTEGDNNPPPSLTGCLTGCQQGPLCSAPEISAHLNAHSLLHSKSFQRQYLYSWPNRGERIFRTACTQTHTAVFSLFQRIVHRL